MRHCIPADGFNSWAPQKAGPCIYSDAAGGTNAWGLSGFQEYMEACADNKLGWNCTYLTVNLDCHRPILLE